ncbi:protein zer-1 homolog [Amphibalanus amphitrite]|uniref:protein zer-1 homolog n=1 Tax=Amphibalanus amphitrite TaxID=1232801 RepID=UPI001C920E73|nr:protein zer-1 homolog [Amphibalanus amphitrite]
MSLPVPRTLEPPALAVLAARLLVQHPWALGSRGSHYPWDTSWRVSRYVLLTEEVADLLLAECRRLRPQNGFLSLLSDAGGRTRRVRLQTVDVRGLPVDAGQLVRLMVDRPRVLRFDSAVEFSADSLCALRDRCVQLRQLTVSGRSAPTPMFMDASLRATDLEKQLAADQPALLPCPQLRSFTMVGSASVRFCPTQSYLDALLRGFSSLTHLELSNVYSDVDVSFVARMPRLVALVLHNVSIVSMERLACLSELRHLDISSPPPVAGRRRRPPADPDRLLERLVRGMPHLEHLDISGTALAGPGVHCCPATEPHKLCDIVGLSSRVGRPLQFLGIYGCNASHRKHIPALRIGGDIGETQLLLAAAAHRRHVFMVADVLEQLEMLLQMNNGVTRWQEILHLALDSMDEFSFCKDIHIRCGAIIQTITSSRVWHAALTEVERQRVLRQLFRSVALYRKSVRLRHFIAMTLMNFDVPREMMFCFEGFLDTLSHMLSGLLSERDNFVERVLIFLLNKTCCDVDGRRKVMVGERGLVKMLLKAIHARLQDHICDDVMCCLWSCLWNVTDETPENCALFLDNRGMRLFTQCLSKFKTDSGDLVRNMMGLVGNIAEVQHLRAHFMTKETVETFLRLLNYSSADLEISYHAAGVLSNMLSDGPAAWTLSEPGCVEVSARLERAVRGWNVMAERSINYRSLAPIIRLLRCDVPESQLWAAWALANLTQAVPERYGRMVEEEGGARLLRLVAAAGDQGSYLVRLAQLCLGTVDRYRDGGDGDGLAA